jgi:tRNA(Ile)-lysidine synthase
MWDFKLDIGEWDKLGIGVSGGRDSMALLHLILSKLDKRRILVINIEHGIRGEKSRKESEFVLNHCKELEIECVSVRIDSLKYSAERKISIEQAARELRYQEFNRLIEEGRVNKIALAHHKGDQAETIMIRILRGTGINGLVGMSEEGDKFIRPLLPYSRAEIDNYVKSENIPYIDDESNFNNDYTRNYIRNTLFKTVAEKFPDYENSLIRLSENAKDDNDYIMSNVIKPELKGNSAILPISVLNGMRSIAGRSIMLCFNALGVYQDIERRHIDILLKMNELNSGKILDMPYGVKVYREYGNLVFTRSVETDNKDEAVPFSVGLVRFNDCLLNIGKYQGEGLRFDLDKIPEGAIIRYKKDGDIFRKFGGGEKSLSDYMTDIKIPRRLRNSIPLIAKDREILLIAGYEISSLLKVGKGASRIYTIKQENYYEL